MKNIKNKKKILIVGAGIAGEELLDQLKKIDQQSSIVTGFIDDDIRKVGTHVGGVKVLGTINNLESIINDYKIDELFIAIPSAQGETIRRIIDKVGETRVKFRIVPRNLDIILGKVKKDQIREIKVQDLLGRTPAKSKQTEFIKEFKGKKILVTGAAGSIGSEICRQLILFHPSKLVCFDWWENGLFELERELKEYSLKNNLECIVGNIQDVERVKKVINRLKPDYVFHAAAFKHVPLMENNPEEAIKNNIIGTENVALAADFASVKKFVYLSSDKAVDPSSVMGATKFIGEQILKNFSLISKTSYITVRFGNVIGSMGSVAPIFQKQINEGKAVTVTDSTMTRYFMTIPEATQLVLKACIIGKGGEIFVLDMGEQLNILELAKLMIRISGFIPNTDIPIKITGRRQGEKISEALAWENEVLVKVKNAKIYTIQRKSIQNQIIADRENLGRKSEDEAIRSTYRERKARSDMKLEDTTGVIQWSFMEKIIDLKIAAVENDSKRVLAILKQIAPNIES